MKSLNIIIALGLIIAVLFGIVIGLQLSGNNKDTIIEKPDTANLNTNQRNNDYLQQLAEEENILLADDVLTLGNKVDKINNQQKVILSLLEQQTELNNQNEINEEEIEGDEWQDPAEPDYFAQSTQKIEEKLFSEEVDTDWMEDTISNFEYVLSEEEDLEGFQLVYASCGTTLCEMEVNLNPDLPVEVNMEMLARHRTWNGPTMFKSTNGQVKFLFAREGEELPL